MKKKNNYVVPTILNIIQILLAASTVGVRKIGVLDNIYVRISLFALEAALWILMSMYLYIRYDLKGGKNAFKTAFFSVLPVMILTGAAAVFGYLGDNSSSSWLLFSILGTSLTFYNKPAVLLTGLIPIADAYIMFIANYAVIFISCFVGSFFGSAINIKLDKDEEEEEDDEEEDMSVTQYIEKIEDVSHEEVVADEELDSVVLEESYDDEDENDSTTAIVSIDDDDDDSEILSQEAVEIISLEMDELGQAAEEELKKRYDDISSDEDVEDELVGEVSEDEIIFSEVDDVFETDEEKNTESDAADEIFTETAPEAAAEEINDAYVEETVVAEAEDAAKEEQAEYTEDSGGMVTEELIPEEIPEEITVDTDETEELLSTDEEIESLISLTDGITEENGWTFLTEEESDCLISLALASGGNVTKEDEEYDSEEGEEVTEKVSFEEIMDIISGESPEEMPLIDPFDDEDAVSVEEIIKEAEETPVSEDGIVSLEEDELISLEEEFNNLTTEDVTAEFITPEDEITDEEVIEEIIFDEMILPEDEEIIPEEEIPDKMDEFIISELEEMDAMYSETEEFTFSAAENIVEDFSDITIEDIESSGEITFEDIFGEETEDPSEVVITAEIPSEEEDDLTIDEETLEEILTGEDDDITEDEIKMILRGEVISEDSPAEDDPEDISEDELSIIADYVEAISRTEIENIVKSEKTDAVKKKQPSAAKDKEKQKKKQRDKEFDNWLNRKTARLDVRAIKEALKDSEE